MPALRLHGPVELRAAVADKPRRFEILAYTGGVLRVDGFELPVVLDLAGLEAGARVPILCDHRATVDDTIGLATDIRNTGRELILAGTVTGDSPRVVRVLTQADKGHEWQASVGCVVIDAETVPAGQSVAVNGQRFAGPIIVARRAELRETSVLPAGADSSTTVNLAARAALKGTASMTPTFEEWAASLELDVASMTEEAVAELRKAFDAMQSGGATAEAAASLNLQAAQAAKLAALRAARPKSPHAILGDAPDSAQVLEAGLALSCGMPERFVGRFHDERVMNAAVSAKHRRTGLHEILLATLRAAGKPPTSHRVTAETIRSAFECDRMLRASGFSTISLPGILSNALSKTLLSAYEAVGTTWRSFCAVESNSNFKDATRYRLTGAGEFQQVAPTGELKHFTLSEEGYTNSLDTYGSMIVVTRKMLIDDDLSAMQQMPAVIGRQAAIRLEKAVFELLLSNPSSFFGSGNANYFEGAATSLQISTLATAEQKFMDQVDDNGDSVMIAPAVLLVPTALHTLGRQILATVTTVTDAADSVPNSNPFAGRFKLEVSPWLNSQNLTGSSSTAWYLLTAGGDIAIMEVAFLNGQQSPTIESGDTDFNTLGVQMRGYFDFGVAMRDTRAGVKSKGAA